MQDEERRQRVIKEELERLLLEMEHGEREAGGVSRVQCPLTKSLRLCFEMAGAILLGILCGMLSHVGVILLIRSLS